jgi:hypothetical protein
MKTVSIRKLNGFLKKIFELKGQVRYLSKKDRVVVNDAQTATTDGTVVSRSYDHLHSPLKISAELAFFLQVPPGTLMKRSDIMTALCVYCYLNPEETRENVLKWKYLNTVSRDLRDKSPGTKGFRIIPDEVLNDLLAYDNYIIKVRANEVYKNVTNKETGLKSKELVSDEGLYIWTFSKLINRHIGVDTVASPRL